MSKLNIRNLIRRGAFVVGSDWRPDENASDNSPVKGHSYHGKCLCANASDLFFWACADGEKLPENDCSGIEQAIADCEGDEDIGVLLWVCRQRQMRPQGPYYSYFDKKFWHLFDECGEEREIGFGNPCHPGEYPYK